MLFFNITQEENMAVATDRQIPLDKALELLKRKNIEAQELEQEMRCTYELIYENELVYQSAIELPIENFNLFQLIRNDLTEEGILSEEANQFLTFLKSHFPKSYLKEWNQTVKEQEKQVKLQQKEAEKQLKKQEKQLKATNTKKISKKSWFIMGGILTAIVVCGLVVFATLRINQATQPTYQELMKRHEYIEAVKQFPESKLATENSINQSVLENNTSKNREELEAFNSVYPTPNGEFDLAILKGDYQKSIKVYEANLKNFKDDTERQILVGYSYLKLDQVEPVKRLVKETKSIELEEKLFQYNQLTTEINELEKELKELEKGGSKNKEKAQKVIEKKFKLQEEQLNL